MKSFKEFLIMERKPLNINFFLIYNIVQTGAVYGRA